MLEAMKQVKDVEGWNVGLYKRLVELAVELGADLPAPYDSIDESWCSKKEEDMKKREAGLERDLASNLQGQYQENTRVRSMLVC